MRSSSLIIVGSTLLAFCALARASTTAVGTLTDAAGDALGPVADIVSLTITIDSGGTALISARYAPGAFSTDTILQVAFDVDKNPATGLPGRNGGGVDAALFGADAILTINGSAFQDNAQLFSTEFASSGNTYPVTYLANGTDVTVPLADLGSANGLMNFVGSTARELSTTSSSFIQDYIPELGQPAGTVVPEPGVLTAILGAVGLLFGRNRRAFA